MGRWGRARRAGAAVTAVAAVVLVGAALAPAASAKKASTTTTSTTTSTTVPAAWDPRLQPIVDKVAELRGLTFDHPVAAEFLDDAAFEKKVAVDRGKLTKDDKDELARAQGQLRALGLISADVDLTDAIESLQQSGVAAYYDPKKKTITVKGTNLDDVATRVTVAHELTHALQDQHYDLQKMEKTAKGVHGQTALRSLVEGDAARIQTNYEKSLSPEEQQAYQTERSAKAKEAFGEISAAGVPDIMTTAFQAPYALGESMLVAVVAKNQAAGVDALFAQPPVADATFVTPTALIDGRTFQTVDAPLLEKGEKRSGKPDQFGAFSLFQVLASRLDNATALTAADAWDGDSMVTFTRKGATCLRTTFAGRGPDGTAAITDALNRWAAQMPAGSAAVNGTPDRVTLTACDPGAAGTAIPNNVNGAFAFLANRDGFLAVLMQQGAPEAVATCSADTLVRDPAFAPLIEAAGNDPTADPDPALITAVQTRAREIVAQCRQSNPS